MKVPMQPVTPDPMANPRTLQMMKLWNSELFRHRNVEHVHIDRLRMIALAMDLAEKDPQVPDWRISNVLPENNRAFSSYVFYNTAVNFCFTGLKKPHHRFRVVDDTGEYSGSLAMGRCFYRHFGENPIKADSIRKIACSDRLARQFFSGATEIPLLEQRMTYLLEAANMLQIRFDDDPMNILEQSNYHAFENESGLGAIEMVEVGFPKSFGMDCAYHHDDHGQNWPLRFSKRAQLWLMMYEGRAMKSGGELPLLRSDSQLGPIADSAVPNALREHGVLKYAKELAEKIDNHTELGEHSQEVIEIRLATVVAVQLLLEAVNRRRTVLNKRPISFLALDNLLWKVGRSKKVHNPAHLSRTTDY